MGLHAQHNKVSWGFTALEQSEGVNGWKITEQHQGEGILTEPA